MASNKRTYRDLPARPIMIYPPSEEQRAEIVTEAKAESRRTSNFVIWVMKKYIWERADRLARKSEPSWIQRGMIDMQSSMPNSEFTMSAIYLPTAGLNVWLV
jgi:hypothetical protein